MNVSKTKKRAGMPVIFALLALTLAAGARAQTTPFQCSEQAYVVQGNATDQSNLTKITYSGGGFIFDSLGGDKPYRINNMGFRYTDGLLYAWRIASNSYSAGLLKIDATGTVVAASAITGMPTSSSASSGAASSNLNAGDVSADGKYIYLTDSGGGAPLGNPNLYVIDLTTTTPKLVATILIRDGSGNRPTGPNNDLKRKVNDFAYNRIDGLLYGADQNSGELAILDPNTGIRTDVPLPGLPFDATDTNIRYGGAWFDFAGTLYLYENKLGTIYPVTFPGGVPTLGDPIQGISSTDVDAAACAGGPMPAIDIQKTVYEGWDSGASAPGSEFVQDPTNGEVTYVFTVTNTGKVDLYNITIDDGDLAITEANLTLITGLSDDTPPLAPGEKLVYYYEATATASFVNEACVTGNTAAAGTGITVEGCDPAIVLVTCEEQPPSDGEGCTPGYWKQPQHLDSWLATGYNSANLVSTVFGVGPDISLLEALKLKGGGEYALIRHAVAALLNAASPDVDYAYTVAEVIAIVQLAYSTGDFEGQKYVLERQNESFCLLD